MAKMRAVQVSKAGGPFEVVEREVPTPGPGQVRIKVEACGVCHSDAIVKFGVFPGLQLPRIPGHEIAGKIDTVGEGVGAWRVGERVGVGWHGGALFRVQVVSQGLVHQLRKSAGVRWSATTAATPSSWSCRKKPWRACRLIWTPRTLHRCCALASPPTMRFATAAHAPAIPWPVQGHRGLGHLGLQFAAKMGFRTVAISRGADKEALARQLGAHEYVDTQVTTAAEGLQKLGGADLVLATAPTPRRSPARSTVLKPRGKLLIVAALLNPVSLSAFSLLTGKNRGWLAPAAQPSIRKRLSLQRAERSPPAHRALQARASGRSLRQSDGEPSAVPRGPGSLKGQSFSEARSG